MRRIRSVNNRLYLLIDKIGRGASSIVFQARPIEYNSSLNENSFDNPRQSRAQQTAMTSFQGQNIKFQGQESVAIKIMNLKEQNASMGEGTQLKKIKQIQTELKILSALNMEGVIKLIDYQFSEQSEMVMVLEYCGFGCFNEVLQLFQDYEGLHKNREEILLHYVSQLIVLLSSLNAYGISHRDIKAENIVFDSKYRLKLIDFASAEIFDEKLFAKMEQKTGDPRLAQVVLKIQQCEQKQSKSKAGGYIGSRHYISPEMIGRARTKEISENLMHYSKTDAWSLGILIYRLFTKEYPFDGQNNFQILRAIRKDDPNLEKLPQHLRQIVKGLLVKQVQNRLSVDSLKSMLPFSNFITNKQLWNSPSPILKLQRSPIQSEIIYDRDLLVGKINAFLVKKRVVILNKQVKIESQKEEKPEEGAISSGQLVVDQEISIKMNDNTSQQNQFSSAKMLTEPENKEEHLVANLEEIPSMTKMLHSQKKAFLCIMKLDCNLLQKEFQLNKSVIITKDEGNSTISIKGRIEDDQKKKENGWSMALKAENQQIIEEIYGILHKIIFSLD